MEKICLYGEAYWAADAIPPRQMLLLLIYYCDVIAGGMPSLRVTQLIFLIPLGTQGLGSCPAGGEASRPDIGGQAFLFRYCRYR